MRAILAKVLLLTVPTIVPTVSAQEGPATGTVSGRLVDETTDLPILRGWICESYDPARVPRVGNCVQTDTLGRFLVDMLPLGKVDLWVTCNARSRRLDSPAMDRVTLRAVVRPDETDLGSIRVDGALCDQRPMIRKSGEFVGYYSAGFESSRFRWNGDSTMRIWVVGSRIQARGSSIRWPTSTRENPRPCALVRWHGTLVGPGQYGHLGVSDYQFVVDSVSEVSEAPKASCAE
jgi:hypothetical protein